MLLPDPSMILPNVSPLDVAVWVAFGTIAGGIYTIYNGIKSQRQTKKLELMKNLAYYETELTKNRNEFFKSPQMYSDCIRFSRDRLVILDRISFLKVKRLIDSDFVNYFENYFNHGRSLLAWLKYMENKGTPWDNVYASFEKIQNSVEYNLTDVPLFLPFYYYSHNKSISTSTYNPKTDTGISSTYDATDEDINEIKSKIK